MGKKLSLDLDGIQDTVRSVGIDLSLIETLIKFLDSAMNDELDITHTDTANLTVILRCMIAKIKDKYEKLEQSLNT